MLNKELLKELQLYVDNHMNRIYLEDLRESVSYNMRRSTKEIHNIELEDFIKKTRKQTFNQVLFNFIDKRNANDSDTYKRAGIDRRHFSKIRSNPNYRPKKNTVIALALALELNKKETDKLLNSAGYSLSDSETFDLVIQFCLERKIYDINHINQALDYFSLKPLIGTLY